MFCGFIFHLFLFVLNVLRENDTLLVHLRASPTCIEAACHESAAADCELLIGRGFPQLPKGGSTTLAQSIDKICQGPHSCPSQHDNFLKTKMTHLREARIRWNCASILTVQLQ